MNALFLAGGGTFMGLPNALVSQLLAFALLAFFIWKFGLPVIRKMMGDRSKEISDSFERLEREAKAASQKIAELQAKLQGIDAESKKRHQAALDEGAAARAQAITEGNAQAAAELEKAKRSIGIERDKAVLELRTEVARLTLEATEKAVDVLMNEKLHGRIVDGYLEGVEKAARGR